MDEVQKHNSFNSLISFKSEKTSLNKLLTR